MSVFAPKYKILTTQTTFTKIYVSFVPVFNEATLKYCIINSKLKLISNTEQYVKHDFELFEKNSGRDTSRTLYVILPFIEFENYTLILCTGRNTRIARSQDLFRLKPYGRH